MNRTPADIAQRTGSDPANRQSAIGNRQLRRRRAGGFTLIEAALTTVIISTGVLAILAAQQAFHKKNDWAQRSGTALLLANELRELTMVLPKHDPFTGKDNFGPEENETSLADYDDVDDFAGPVTTGIGQGLTFQPPINALRQTIPDMDKWSQHIDVASVLKDNISSTFTQPIGSTDLLRVTVTVMYQGANDPDPVTIGTLSWIVTE